MTRKKSAPVTEPFEHPNVSAEDWRLYAATALSSPAIIGGTLHPKGSVVKRVKALSTSRDGPRMMVGAPSITAMLLDVSARFDIAGMDVPDHFDESEILQDPRSLDARLFDGLEKRMGSVVFAVTALESFANEIVEHAYGISGFRYEREHQSGLKASLDIDTVRRHVQIEEKIGVVVPQALGMTSPKGRTPYNNFKRLKDLRDRIVHCKGVDQGYSNDPTLWRELLKRKSANCATQIYELIGYFYGQAPQIAPRWYRAWPYHNSERTTGRGRA